MKQILGASTYETVSPQEIKELALILAVDVSKRQSTNPYDVIKYAKMFEKYLLGKDE